MKTKRTPGPWSVRKIESYEFQIDEPSIQLTFQNHIKDQDATEANARLIAAAPEMLEALEFAQRVLFSRKDNSMGDEQAYNAITAAIRKARGDS